MAATLTAQEIRDANARYHDVAADDYDAKWGIDFGPAGRRQVLQKLEKALGSTPPRFGRSLEIGAGTGCFTLNLLRSGTVQSAVATDISPGMLAQLERNARHLQVDVETAAVDAEALPFASESFDLVFGHAVLHHLPDLARAFDEFARVLRPGGVVVFAGEPSRHGDRLASVPKRGAHAVAPAWRRLIGARAIDWEDRSCPEDHALEHVVDVHAFTPDELRRLARGAEFEAVRVRGEELLANWFGWANRALEATAEPRDIPWLWCQYAYRGYLALQQVDTHLLEPRLPPAIFYNLMLAARRPAHQRP